VSRTEARTEAVQALYAADALGVDPETGDLGGRPAALVNGVWANRAEIDEVISRLALGWRLERMPTVDRNVLRLGVYELLYTDTPVGVVVSEAVELAKVFSTSRSGAFVNGVLGKLARELGGRQTAPGSPAP
jgi:N utilization substance protein B